MGRPKKYKTDEERRQAKREYERSPARREYKRQWAINKKKNEMELINDNRKHSDGNKGYTANINFNGNNSNNFNNNANNSINLQNTLKYNNYDDKKLNSDDANFNNVNIGSNEAIDIDNNNQDKNINSRFDNNEQQNIFEFNEVNQDKTFIINDNNYNNNYDNIEIEINEEQLKNILSIFVILYVYFRIFDFSISNTIVQQLEQKEKYIQIIDRLTNKFKATIEKYDYLKKLYSNIDDFMFIIDIILLSSVIEDEINITMKKKDNSIEEKQQNTIEPTKNLFERL